MRLIDADAFIEENKNIIDCEIDHPKYQDTLRQLINLAPTVERPQWIPVSERLPEEEGKYLVTMQSFVTRKPTVSTSIFVDSTKEWYPDCTAWMPLPEPYKGEGEAK